MVTICTTSLTFTNSTFCPHSVFMRFVWIWEKTAIISLYNINWLVFITETESVYCAVRTGFSNKIHVNIFFIDRGMAQTVISQPVTPHFPKAPHTSSSTRCYNQEDKGAKPGNLKIAMFFSEIVERCIENNFQFSSLQQVAPILLLVKWGLQAIKRDESILNWARNVASFSY